jgi:L-threonylcarbamoyladenylate synthase
MAWAASVVRHGGVIVYPTETFYGLGGRPDLEETVERIYLIKGRDFKKPLPLIAADLDAVRRAVAQWPPVAEKLAQAFWPGPLTMVLPASPHLPQLLHAHTGKAAVRISSHPVAGVLAASVGGLLIATSANIAGDPASSSPDRLSSMLLLKVDGILDGGELPGVAPSTIVDVSVAPPRLLREGRLHWREIDSVIG